MVKKEMIAMLLAGGQGSRLGVLTSKVAKPAVSFGGKYRIIDFPLSNCINSGVDTVGVLTQYQPLRLNSHIGIGIPWDLDRNIGGVSVLPPYESVQGSEWYSGTANAIYQNMEYIENYNPDYVLILSGDHIYKMDYEVMLDFHKSKGIVDFEEKPKNPRSNLASMGIYIFNWKTLRDGMIALKDQPNLDFGKHIIPYCRDKGAGLYAYEFNSYWKDVGTLHSYWQANMELIDIVPEFNLYEEYWKIYTKSDIQPPQYFSSESEVSKCIIGVGSEIYGKVYNSVIGCGVRIGKGTIVRDSIIMNESVIGDDCELTKAIVAEKVTVGNNVVMGIGDEVPNDTAPQIYTDGLVTIGEKSTIPDGVRIGKNSVVYGETTATDYPDNCLPSGRSLITAEE